MATTTGTPNLLPLLICLIKLGSPCFTKSTFSVVYSGFNGMPGVTAGPPPCIFNARTVVTRTTASGVFCAARHLMSKNFSMPMSEPKPASVTQKPFRPTNFNAILSAIIDEQPCAIFANGPACTKTGVPFH